jgi:hypothetical protein
LPFARGFHYIVYRIRPAKSKWAVGNDLESPEVLPKVPNEHTPETKLGSGSGLRFPKFFICKAPASIGSHLQRSYLNDRALSLEPIAAVGYPPTHKENRDSRSERPPEWQNEFSDQPQCRESDPKDFPFQYLSL